MRVENRRTYIALFTETVRYIGRGSIYGNPFVIGIDGTREGVIEKYENMPNYWKLVYLLDKENPDVVICYCSFNR